MVTDFEELVALCDEELRHREYHSEYYVRLTRQWDALRSWLKSKGLSQFNEKVANDYCDATFGTHVMPKRPTVSFREKLRAVRMLVSYQKNGDFEFRCPSVEYTFEGDIGREALRYLEYCKTELSLAEKTIENKRRYLYHFCEYMKVHGFGYEDLSPETTEAFFSFMDYTLASRHNAARNIRLFLTYAYKDGKSLKDHSVYILPDNYRKDCKLPTTYEEDEIRELVSSVERASAIGRRDYLILLLASEYGWRAKDITKFAFSDIDWDHNVIRFDQHKTGYGVEFPLLSTVGNAIIDYLKYARPKTEVPEVIVSMENANKGKPLSPTTIHSIVTKYMKRAGIKNWEKKKHGPHSLRHSLATNLLKKNVSLPIISTVMGHQRTSTTTVYISVDYEKLKQCALPMPALRSSFYDKEDSHGQV